jgi:general secretion pathway protein E
MNLVPNSHRKDQDSAISIGQAKASAKFGSADGPLPRTADGFLDFLVAARKLGTDSLARIQSARQATGEPLSKVLTQLGFVAEEEIAHALSSFLDIPLANEALILDPPVLADRLSAEYLKYNKALPLRLTDDCADIGFVDPLDPVLVESFQFALNKPIVPHILREKDFDALFSKLYSPLLTATDGNPDQSDSAAVGIDDLERLQDSTSTAPVVRLVSSVIGQAVEASASDVHIEPSEDFLRVRYRIDGVLNDVERHPATIGPSVISRIKILARLNISERRLPQDGRIKLAVRGRDIDLRVSTTPTMHGESVVLRILDRSAVRLDLPSLGFSASELTRFRSIMDRPHGILLVTGPTGSGKTTTLYASLLKLNSEQRKLLTVEDPIEYQLPGVNQVQIRPLIGLTFAHALRSFLRQDPDIMMVGEIRDLETAQIAVQAALTGHLILSTLHTNDAASAITRLLDMGLENYLLASTINGIVGQRLVRSLCSHCKQAYQPDGETLRQYGFSETDSHFHRAVGCSSCHGTGYKGRRAIVEILPITDTIHALIIDRADAMTIRRAALSEGMNSMFAVGRALVTNGETSLDELLRVIRDD